MAFEKEMLNIVRYSLRKPNTKIVPNISTNTDLNAILQSLANQAEKATSIDKIQEIVDILPELNNERERRIRQDISLLKEQENVNSIIFSRKMKIVREAFRIIASIGSVVIGLYLIAASPLLGPLLITLGIAGALNYQLKDVAELASKINSSKTSYDLEPYDGNQDKSLIK